MNARPVIILIIFFSHLYLDKIYAQGDGLYRMATDYYFQGKYQESLQYLDSAIQLNSEDISRFFFRSRVHERLGNYESAITDLTICIEKSLHDELYLNKRAELFELMQQPEMALKDYNTSIRLKSTWEAHYRRGLIFFKLNQLQKALDDLNRAIELNKYQADPLRARAYLRLKMDDNEGACMDMFQVFEMGFDDVRSWLSEHCG